MNLESVNTYEGRRNNVSTMFSIVLVGTFLLLPPLLMHASIFSVDYNGRRTSRTAMVATRART